MVATRRPEFDFLSERIYGNGLKTPLVAKAEAHGFSKTRLGFLLSMKVVG
jgi:hypothetical protein